MLLSNSYATNFSLQHMQKDLRLALGDKLKQNPAPAAASNELFKRARITGHADDDIGAVFCAIR